jgi:tetratricopeptide (TPR) repeat protein
MGSIKFRTIILYFLICSLFIINCSLLLAQTFGPAGSFSDEMQRLDAIIAGTNLGTKKTALVEKASLLEMTGSIEEAARTWNEAAFAESAQRDDNALLRSAACFTAMGEYSQADDALRTILLTGTHAASIKNARLLSAKIEVLRNGEQSFPVLLSFLENPEYASSKPGIYYLLWKISGSETYKAKLINDFPQSPEALLAQGNNASLTPAFTPMWLLFPGREQLVVSVPVTNTPSASSANTSENPSVSATETPVLLQVGLYSRQENAEAMVDRLSAKGFSGNISTKTVSGTVYWQVTLPPGQDSNQTIMILKDAGFESFPVFQ